MVGTRGLEPLTPTVSIWFDPFPALPNSASSKAIQRLWLFHACLLSSTRDYPEVCNKVCNPPEPGFGQNLELSRSKVSI